MQIETVCCKCKKSFKKTVQTKNHSPSEDTCYDCTLESLTNGQCPEEGDFNTARISSGEMSEDERRLLWEDLQSVDRAACMPDPEDDEPDWQWFDGDEGESFE